MHTFFAFLRILYLVLSALTTAVMLYQLLIALAAVKKLKRPTPCNQKLHRFAVLVSARNEQAVIGYLLDSLCAQDYPRELFDLYVMADYCTDATADVAREHGARVLERREPAPKGKGAALDDMLAALHREHPGEYDAFCVFDADNVAEPGFLAAMNEQLQAGVAAAQGYRDIKNPSVNWISGAYAIYFYSVFRFYLHARSVLGLSGLLTGTGFMLRADLLQEGFGTRSITEDSEFTVKLVSRGYKVAYAPWARFYDEQPETFMASLFQRYRWAVGAYQVAHDRMGELWHFLCHGGGWEAVDKFIYLLSVPCSALAVINTGLGVSVIFQGNLAASRILLAGVAGTVITALAMLIQGVLAVVCSGVRLKALWKGILGWPIFLFIWGYINVVSIFWRDTTWRPIPHRRGVSVKNLQEKIL